MRKTLGWGYMVTALRVGEGSWAHYQEIFFSFSDPEPHPADHRHLQLSKGTPAWLCVVTCGIKCSSLGIVLASLSSSPKYTVLLGRVSAALACLSGSGHTGVKLLLQNSVL